MDLSLQQIEVESMTYAGYVFNKFAPGQQTCYDNFTIGTMHV